MTTSSNSEHWASVKRLIAERGYTHQQFAQRLGRSVNTVTGWLSGRKRDYMTVAELVQIAAALDCDPAEIAPEVAGIALATEVEILRDRHTRIFQILVGTTARGETS